ncbi:major facilitator superfamily domain-containing protein [Stachybotrys elegans]|uniref:Major facilitator superfamily domain-containing protein n=1 Tax=Stachybotrys elegans TaxID=80388 RepID=A0A8K0WTK9_9HYPO|nr:major facilitator superfamily domain-containing protein [Stachybotrys elegans]
MDVESTPTFPPSSTAEPVPDGGYGWVVVFSCFVQTFWLNAWTGPWGILQIALLRTTLSNSNSSILSFIGSLGISLSLALGIAAVQVARVIGARWASLLGIVLYGVGNVASGFAVHSVPGMFIACGFLYGLSVSLMYAMSNSLPVQWFDKRLGTANGVVKLGGGIGATVMAIVTGYLTDSLGVAWTFRIMGFASLATGIPAALLIKERLQPDSSFIIDWSLFKDVAFCCLFTTGVLGVFAIYAPPFFLPYVASSIGLSSSVSAGVVACFNACMAIGRLASGFACDKLGSMNTLLLTMLLNAITMMAVWSVASSLAILLVFAIFNGIANGAFFVALPTAISRHVGQQRAAGGMSIALTGWAPGLLLGNPIAGFLIDATGADRASSIGPYRPAIFYAGGTAMLSAAFALMARLRAGQKVAKKI